MAIPEDGASARARVYDDDSELIGRAASRPRRLHVDALAGQALARQPYQIVVAEHADIRRTPSQTCADGAGGPHLPTRQPGETLEPLLAVARRVLRNDGYEIDAVQAECNDIE